MGDTLARLLITVATLLVVIFMVVALAIWFYMMHVVALQTYNKWLSYRVSKKRKKLIALKEQALFEQIEEFRSEFD